MYWGKIDYKAKIHIENNTTKYYIEFIDSNKHEQNVEVSKIVFLQFFGVRATLKKDNPNYLYIKATDGKHTITHLLTEDELKSFNSFKQQEKHQENEIDRHYIHQSLTDEQLYCLNSRIFPVIENEINCNELYVAINNLKDIQKRRLIKYFFKNMTYEEISIEEGCTKRAVKFSIDAALSNLRKKIKK